MAAVFELVSYADAAAIAVMADGLAFYHATVDVTRTRLRTTTLSLVLVFRAALNLAFGAFAFWISDRGWVAALAIGLAYFAASLPALPWVAARFRIRPPRAIVQRTLYYGWPLALAFSISAVGITIDRIMVGAMLDRAAVGSYAAIGDTIRQVFVVLGESIAFSLVAAGRHAWSEGDQKLARTRLTEAFRTLITCLSLGVAFFVVFSTEVLHVLLGERFREAPAGLVVLLAAAFSMHAFRAYFLGQVIYFGANSVLETISAAAILAVTMIGAACLIPSWGVVGAALALCLANAPGCVVFLLGGARAGAAMPWSWPVAFGVLLVAVVAVSLDHWAAPALAELGMTGLVIKIATFGAIAAATLLCFDVLSVREMIRAGIRRSANAPL